MGGRSGQRQKRHRRPVGGRARWAQPTKMQPWGQRAQGGGSRAQREQGDGRKAGRPGAPVRLMARTAPRPLGQACVSKSALLLHLHTINGNLLTSGGTGHHLPPRLVAEGRFWIIHTSPGRLQGLRRASCAPPAPRHFHPRQPLRSPARGTSWQKGLECCLPLQAPFFVCNW